MAGSDCVALFVCSMLVMFAGVVKVDGAGCKDAKLCCQGKDNVCVVEGSRVNGQNNDTCFCDSACSILQDCCLDYSKYCKPINCLLADKWQDWGECDVRCGLGTKQRQRRVVQPPQNGGKPCGPTVQKAVCEGTNCKLPRASGAGEELRETGKILPENFAKWRSNKQFNPFRDIRRNLFEKHNIRPYVARPTYCATYELTDVRPGCKKSRQDWTKALTKGSTVCVECQSVAMQRKLGGRCQGHGVYLRETRWTTLTSPDCHGAWVMKTKREDCECPKVADGSQAPSFIFV